MARAIWSGSISFGLVNAPVRMYPAVHEHDLELHLVHVKDGSPIGYRKYCKKEDKAVSDKEIAKAYKANGKLVLLEDEDFAAAQGETYKTIEILDFVPYEQIDPIYFERTYYLGPEQGAEKVYALLVAAMEQSELAGLVRYVFHDRERLGCLRVRDGVLLIERMYFADEIRPHDEIRPKRRRKVDDQELELALSLIGRITSDFDPSRVRGPLPQAPARGHSTEAQGQDDRGAGSGEARRAARSSRRPARERRARPGRRPARKRLQQRKRVGPRRRSRRAEREGAQRTCPQARHRRPFVDDEARARLGHPEGGTLKRRCMFQRE